MSWLYLSRISATKVGGGVINLLSAVCVNDCNSLRTSKYLREFAHMYILVCVHEYNSSCVHQNTFWSLLLGVCAHDNIVCVHENTFNSLRSLKYFKWFTYMKIPVNEWKYFRSLRTWKPWRIEDSQFPPQ